MDPRTQNKVATNQFNELALLSLFLSVIFPPAALVIGLIAKGQINKTNERGKSFAVTAIVFGALFIAFIVFLILVSIASVNSYNNTYYSY